MRNKTRNISLTLLVCLALVGLASAKVLTAEVEGVVTSFGTEGGFALDSSVSVSSVMTGFCIYDTDPVRLLEAQLLALDVSCELRPPADLTEQIYSDLAAIRSSYPEVADITYRQHAVPDQIIVGLTQEAAEQFRNGQYHAIDELNQLYGVIEINDHLLSFISVIILKFNQVYNTRLLSDIYAQAEGVRYAEPNYYRGDGSTISANPPFYTFIRAWGDCPAGCIYRRLYHFRVENGQVTVPDEYYVDAIDGDDDNYGLSPETAFATIQKAIDSAFDGDTVLVADGTYTGPGNRDIDFLGKAITVRSESGPENCIIDCEALGRGFYFHNNEDNNSILDGFTITNGNNSREGGGIFCYNSSPTITNCTITGNLANWGGGIACRDSSPIVTNCTITTNSAEWDGGGINCWESNPTITNCTITGNLANWGGGISCYESSPTITNCTITGNTAGVGGGISCDVKGSPTITNCTITGNSAGHAGGGIMGSLQSNITISNCILWANEALYGPQISLEKNSNAWVSYTDVQGGQDNIYLEPNGELFWGEGNIDANPSFAFNDDYHLIPDSPCIDAGTNEPPGGLSTEDLDGNARVLDGDGDRVDVVDMGAYEFDAERPLMLLSTTSVEIFVPEGRTEANDQIVSIRNGGGDKLKWKIVEDCPWLKVFPKAGTCTGEIDDVRFRGTGTGLEHGDYSCVVEVVDRQTANSSHTIKVTLHVNITLAVPGQYGTIQAAIDNCVDGDVVIVADGTYTGPGNRDIDFLGKAITVKSENGPENCIIDCEALGRGFYFHNGEDENSILIGFTIINGYHRLGGAIYCSFYSSPMITNCIITGNSATYDGGGIYCYHQSSPTITNCTISGNKGRRAGGGIYCVLSNPTIANCTITGNTAHYFGGGILSDLSNPTIANCKISGNSADWGGGISCAYYSSPTIDNCTVTSNSAGHAGGGIHCRDSSPVITNCTIVGNTAEHNGGGINSNYYSNPTITNCILWDNLPEQIYGHPSITYSDIQQQDEWPWWDYEGCISADPCFVEPGYWDVNDLWIDGDYHLLRTSPCIDAAAEANVYTDIEGNVRPFDFPGVDNNGELPEFDMGAYELVPIEAEMKLAPQMLNCSSKGNWVKAHFVLPEEFLPEDVDVNAPAVAEPIGAESEYIELLGSDKGPVRLEVVFDREAFCDGLTDTDDDSLEITIIGSFTTSRYFRGTDTVRIKPRR